MTSRGVPFTLLLFTLFAGLGSGVASVGALLVPAVPPSFPERAQQRVLEEEVLRFARAWVDGDLQGLESMLVPEGIRLHIQGDLYPSVDVRRAASALRGFLGRYAGGELEVMRVSQSSGEESRGFAELQWRTEIPGTGESVAFTLFVGYAAESGGWTVTEIRVLP
jgi:hypothetical protein